MPIEAGCYVLHVSCDGGSRGDRCAETTQFTGGTRYAAMAAARQAGWQFDDEDGARCRKHRLAPLSGEQPGGREP